MPQATQTDAPVRELSPEDVRRLFDEGYHRVEILPNGTLREVVNGDRRDETVTRSLKTQRTWY